ncbi:MAG: thioredoxin family protein [Bacteroidetes bacterium]|nr:thioredoxin family protein [Bacteroidota bacterium]MCL2302512.1 thioredoxin family protein [Lentimicrobiaceae bacterium]
MKTQKKNLVLLLIITIAFMLSCGNANNNTDNAALEEPKTDHYALLKDSGRPERIAEDLSGRVILLSEQDFIERITAIDNPKGFQYLGQTPCVVDLYASWCKPCGLLSENLRTLAPEYQGKVIFYKLDIDKAREVAYMFNVQSIPMLLYFKPHGKISSTVGYLNKDELRKAIDEYLLNP